ncbi:small nuclear ribonucleoprotein G-like [Neofelis nebulosa]|uniref:small nuclear ribonucleoprotein G-like n=1 Tax=Neofelis nebulosa TaxID=61452 RepID=UPI00272C137B|nr:small nuclear ribonucleoprotein G-like [Neofelis nebulosa]
MSKAPPTGLEKFMDKKLLLKLNGGRHSQGNCGGVDPFMNLVIDECVEMATSGRQNDIRMAIIPESHVIVLGALAQA